MLADHAAGVLAGRPGLGAKRRRARGEPQRQQALVEDLVGDEIGQRHLGGRDQPQPVGGAEHVLGSFRQLPGAEGGLVAHQEGRRDFRVAELAGVQVEHELGERPLQPRQIAPQYDKPRSRKLAGAAKIHQPEPLADGFVRQGLEIEPRRLTLAPHQPVRGLVGSIWHLVRRQVRQSGKGFVNRDAQPRRLCGASGLCIFVRSDLTHQWQDRHAARLGHADLSGEAVEAGLCFLGGGLGDTP